MRTRSINWQKKLFVCLAVGSVTLILALFLYPQFLASSATHPAQNQAVQTILITSSGFDPAENTVPQGTTVEWINQDTATHTVTSDNEPKATIPVTFGTASLLDAWLTVLPAEETTKESDE